MMSKRVLATLLAIAAAWLVVACAGAPPPTPAQPEPVVVEPAPAPAPQPTPEPAPVATPAVPDESVSAALSSEVDAAAAAAAASRKQAFDVGVPTFFPPDWQAAEALYLKARDAAAVATKTSQTAARDGYRAAAAAYDAAAQRALPLFAENRRSEIELARKNAVDRGLADLSPERLAAADAKVDAALTLFREASFYPADAAAVEARDRYNALSVGADAYALRREIDQRNLAKYDAGNYQLAVQALAKGEASYDSGDIAAARDGGDEAFLRFKLALAKGRELYSVDRGKAAEQEQLAARELKAHVAVKADYEAAAALRAQADRAFNSADYDQAAALYLQAENGFAQARAAAAVKRSAAEGALREAEARIEAARQRAAEADIVIEGGAE